MNARASSLLIFMLISALTSLTFVSRTHGASQEIAASAVSQAEEVLASTYELVLEVEEIGVDVSGFLTRLNTAGEHLAKAHIFYGLGDFENATLLANLSEDVGEEVRNDAYELRNAAYAAYEADLTVRIAASVIGVICVASFSFLAWRLFKRRYKKRILKMKPEVVPGAT